MARRRTGAGSIDELVTYAVACVAEAGEECTFERLVYECFARFPESFRFQRYPQWPDAVRINKAWLRCRTDRGWITGSVQEGFRLTERGHHVAARLGQLMGESRKIRHAEGGKARERHEAILRHIRRHESFSRFEQDASGFDPTETELRSLLSGTLETPRRILRQNLHTFEEAAAAYGEDRILAFLEVCKRSLPARIRA